MSEARKCDRCNKLYIPYKKEVKKFRRALTDSFNGIMIIEIVSNGYYPGKQLDLCPDCMDKLLKFLGSEE